MKTPLETILNPLDETTFLQEYFHRRPHQWHTDSGLWKRLREFFSPDRLESLLPAMDKLQVWCLDRSGELLTVPCSPANGWLLYRTGHTLYGSPNPQKLPELADVFELGRSIARDLELSDGDFSLGLFASCKGAHTRCHYDSADGFTMQLQGIKRWAVSVPTVDIPIENHILNLPPGNEMYAINRGPSASFAPSVTSEVTMRPGSMLYVPRAGWHATWTDEDSMSLDFNFSASFRWKNYLGQMVQHLMAPIPEARLPFSSGPSFPDRLESLLGQLRSRLALVQTSHLRPEHGPRPASVPLHWNPLATFFVLLEEERSARVTFHLFSHQQEGDDIEFAMRRPWLGVLDRLRAGGSLTEEEIVATPLPAREVASVLDVLWQEGILLAPRPV